LIDIAALFAKFKHILAVSIRDPNNKRNIKLIDDIDWEKLIVGSQSFIKAHQGAANDNLGKLSAEDQREWIKILYIGIKDHIKIYCKVYIQEKSSDKDRRIELNLQSFERYDEVGLGEFDTDMKGLEWRRALKSRDDVKASYMQLSGIVSGY
jgi:hypothetical protein